MGSESHRAVDEMVAEQKAALVRGDSAQEQARVEASRSLLNEAVHAAVGTVWAGDSATRREVENYTTQFVKAVPLFVGARWGTVAASAAFGLDEVKAGDSLGMQSAEFAAGVTKGYLTKRAFDVFGAKDWNFAKKGMAMGAASRLLDVGLTPSNYVGADGHFDLGEGARRAVANAGDAKALGMDVLTFGVARAVPSALGRGAFAQNGLLASSLTGATFGFTSGTLGELQRQWHTGENVDYGKLLKAGAIDAGVMGLAAGVGYKLTPHSEMTQQQQRWRDKLNEDALRRALAVDERRVSPATDGAERTEQAVGPKVKERAGYTGYFLTEEAASKVRDGLVIDGKAEPPRWTPPEKLHITESFGTKESVGNSWAEGAKGQGGQIRVIGHAVDSTGVEALRVSVDGRTERADGKPYHITRSLAEGRKASESGPVVEKALAVEKAGQAGTASGGTTVTAEDLARYSYRELAPHEQFDVKFEPKWQPSDVTPKEVKKPSEPKPEVPFEQLNPKMQVISALKATSPDYLSQLIATRTPEHRAGSYFELTPEQLKAQLYRANWEPFAPVDANGEPIIGGGAKGYRATISGGRLGMTEIAAIPETAQLYLIDPKGIDNWSVSTVGASEPHTDTATMIVGKEPHESHFAVWTFHPGDPVRPSAIHADTIGTALSNAGVGTDGLRANGPARRIPITRAQLDAINASLPDGSKMTLAKIESEANVGH
jgi:hypothetical protein